jgi:hypothetical protein
LALGKLPFPVECTQALQQLIGPIGPLERDGIHRIAFNSDFYTFFAHQSFTDGLKFLYQTFPELDFLVLAFEPYARGTVEFYNMEGKDFCCDSCFFEVHSGIYEAVRALGMDRRRARQELFRRLHPKVQVRFRGVYRGGVKQPELPSAQTKMFLNCSHGRDELLRVEEVDEADLDRDEVEKESEEPQAEGIVRRADRIKELEADLEGLCEEEYEYGEGGPGIAMEPGVDKRAKIAAFVYGS